MIVTYKFGFNQAINIIGLALGVYWFGWWFLVPGILTGIRFEVTK